MALLDITNLSITFPHERDLFHAVDTLSLSLEEGKTHCLVGESGCGKSVTAFAIMGLLQSPGRVSNGSITFEGDELVSKSNEELRLLRGNSMAMIFQDPMNSLNPVFRCGDQVAEAIRLHQGKSKKEAQEAAIELFRQVRIPDPEKRIRQYPHELSGGMRQRVMIAMALACKPKLLIADEPTTALDVTIQAQILALLQELQESYGMAILFITHDLGVVAQIAHTITVLYAGKVVEQGTPAEIFSTPKHPYTEGLLRALPSFEQKAHALHTITGSVPSAGEKLPGCVFHPRCTYTTEICMQAIPALSAESHATACHHPLTKVTS